MHPSPQAAYPPLSQASDSASQARRIEYVVYQVVTVGAILLVLGTVFIF